VTRKLALACLLGLCAAGFCTAQTKQAAPAQNQDHGTPASTEQAPRAQNGSDDDLPEEDESLKPKVYPFNPLEAERNIKVGDFYMHQGTPRGYRAAVGRFQDATKYNPSSAEAFFRLGEAEEKLKHTAKAKAAFDRVTKLAPDSKLAHEAKKKLGNAG
jgi:tetratricopeptide (TPR) repeat protein